MAESEEDRALGDTPSRRGRAPRAAGRTRVLSRDEIIAAAIELADRDELEGLTMRRLAEVLHVRPMSLYAHVRSKDDVLDALIEHRLRVSGLPDVQEEWRAWTREVAERLRVVLEREPVLLDRYCRRPVGVPAALERMEASLAVLRRAGFSGAEAVAAFSALHSYTIGFAALASARRKGARDEQAVTAEGDARDAAWPAYFAALDPNRFPQLVELRPDLASVAGAAQFVSGLETLLDGLAARALPRRPRMAGAR